MVAFKLFAQSGRPLLRVQPPWQKQGKGRKRNTRGQEVRWKPNMQQINDVVSKGQMLIHDPFAVQDCPQRSAHGVQWLWQMPLPPAHLTVQSWQTHQSLSQ
eukprot:144083-Ditylum_brightwellii.AAC.1